MRGAGHRTGHPQPPRETQRVSEHGGRGRERRCGAGSGGCAGAPARRMRATEHGWPGRQGNRAPRGHTAGSPRHGAPEGREGNSMFPGHSTGEPDPGVRRGGVPGGRGGLGGQKTGGGGRALGAAASLRRRRSALSPGGPSAVRAGAVRRLRAQASGTTWSVHSASLSVRPACMWCLRGPGCEPGAGTEPEPEPSGVVPPPLPEPSAPPQGGAGDLNLVSQRRTLRPEVRPVS